MSAQKNAARCIGGQDKDVFSLKDASLQFRGKDYNLRRALLTNNSLILYQRYTKGIRLAEGRERRIGGGITAYSILIQYLSHKYCTTLGGRTFVLGVMPFASKNILSVFNQRRKVAALTPAASANSYLLIDFIDTSDF